MLALNAKSFTESKLYKPLCPTTYRNGQPSLYDMIYSINEGYYNQLLSITKRQLKEAASNDTKPVIRSALEWLIPASLKFLGYVSKNSKLLDVEMASILKEIQDDPTKTYQHRKFFIKDTKYRFPNLPKNIARKIDKLSYFEQLIVDPSLMEKMNGDLFFEGDLIVWFLRYKTPESMGTFLDHQTRLCIPEGFYRAKKLIPMIKHFSQDSVAYISEIKEDINYQKKELDKLVQKTHMMKSKVMTHISKEYIHNTEVLFKKYESVIELAYLQLSVYQRSLIFLYGKSANNITNAVHSMFDEIPNEHIKIDSIKNHDDIIQNMKKELI